MQEIQTQSNKKKFGRIIIIFQIIIVPVLIALFIKQWLKLSFGNQTIRFSALSLMIILAFSLYLSTIKKCVWSTIIFSFISYIVTIQIYFPLKLAWNFMIKSQGDEDFGNCLEIDEQQIIQALKATLPNIIAMGAVIGRISQNHAFFISLLGTLGYTLLEALSISNLSVQDNGGSIFIFQYGSIYGLTISKMLSHQILPHKKSQKQIRRPFQFQYFSMFGVFLLWVLWPLFNLPFRAAGNCDRAAVVNNTVFSLFGSAIGGLIFLKFTNQHIKINELILVTISGVITSGSSTNLAIQPIIYCGIGIIGSIICCVSLWELPTIQQKNCGIFDSSFILSVIAVPSLLGGFFTIICFSRLLDQQKIPGVYCLNIIKNITAESYSDQAFQQFLAMIVSLFSAIVFGVVLGVLLNSCFSEKERTIKGMYTDEYMFELSEIDPIYFPGASENKKEDEKSNFQNFHHVDMI